MKSELEVVECEAVRVKVDVAQVIATIVELKTATESALRA